MSLGLSSWRTPSVWLFTAASLVLTVRVSLVTPPFHNPDEGAHYLRAYEVSRGHLLNPAGDVGVDISCADYLVAARQYGPIAYYQPAAEQGVEGQPCTVKSVNTAGMYAPVSYGPSALALRVGEAAGWTVEGRLKTARVFNGVVACLFVLCGLLALERMRAPFALASVIPMIFWQRAALSADSLLLASAFFFVCWLVRVAERRKPLSRADVLVFFMSAFLLGSSKIIYAVLCLGTLVFWWKPAPSPWKQRALLAAPFLFALGVAFGWLKAADPALVYIGNNADPKAQVQSILSAPLTFAGVLLDAAGKDGPDWLRQMFVAFDWFPWPPSVGLFGALGVLLLVLIAAEASPFRTGQRLFLGLVAFGVALASVLPLYLTYTPPGFAGILGVQGRYFAPLLPLVATAVAFNRGPLVRLSAATREVFGMVLPLLVVFWLSWVRL